MGDMSKIYLTDSDFLSYTATRYSLVLSAENVDLKREGNTRVADFDIGTGDWIIIAKATVRAGSPNATTMQLRLTAVEGTQKREDQALTTISQLGYATLSLMLGTHVLTRANIQLEATLEGSERVVDLSHLVVSAIKTDKLIVGLL